MFLVVIGVLSIILAFPRPLYRWVQSPEWVLVAAAAATILPVVVAGLVRWRVLRLIERRPQTPGDGQFSYGRGMTIVQFLLASCHAGLLLCTDWLVLCNPESIAGWPVVPSLIALVPFLLSVVLVWVVTHSADAAIRHIALEVGLFRGRPVRPVWTLPQHLVFNLRHQVLFILIPMLLIVAARDVIEDYEDAIRRGAAALVGGRKLPPLLLDHVPDLLLGCAAALTAIIAPAILRRVWVTQRLPNGPLRDRLQAMCNRLKLRCREILVWRSGGVIVNAAVMGLVAPLRYVLITDAMLEQMDDRKVEAVFGHEAGHVKRHHIFFFLMFALISGCLVTVLSVRTSPAAPGGPVTRSTFQVLAAIGGGILLLKWGVVFGWVSRRFERQADVYSVRTLAACGLPCALPCSLHPREDDGGEPAQQANPAPPAEVLGPDAALCSTAAHLFGEALNDVAVLNGIPPAARSWRHSSISSRSRFLQKLAHDPQAARRFERTVYRIKLGILAGALLSGLWAAWELGLHEMFL